MKTDPATIGRSLPHDPQAEAGLIGCFLTDSGETKPTYAEAVAAGITAASFFTPANQTLWSAIGQLKKDGLPLDAAGVAAITKPDQAGMAHLMAVTKAAPTTIQARKHLQDVKAAELRREIIKLGTATVERAFAENDAEEIIAHHSQALVQLMRPTVTRLTVWSPSQFLNYTVDPSGNLLGDGIIESGEWTSLVGIGGLGKTRLALWFVVCQSIGREFCGLRVGQKPQLALFLSTENGLRRWKTDLEKMLGGLTAAEREAVEAHIRILALTSDEEGDLSLSDAANVARLKATLEAVQPGIVVFDPFADMIDGDENKTSDVIATLRKLRGVLRSSAPTAAAIIIHHARTGAANVAQAGDNYSAGNFGRGSKALYSRVRAEMQLAPADRDDPDRLVLACGKSNNGPKFITRGLVFNPDSFAYQVDSSFDVEAWRSDVSGKRTGKTVSVADVVEIVRELAPYAGSEVKAGAIQAEAKERLGVGLRSVRDRLADAVTQNYLRTPRKGVYRLGSKPLPK